MSPFQNGAAGAWLQKVVNANRAGQAVGLFSVCSAQPSVLRAAMRHAADNNAMLSVESTSNQVNQFGGYTGLTPAQFVADLQNTAKEAGLPAERVLIGSDHLGPYPWRKETSSVAMEKACALARDSVLAGYMKIHLDASLPCADDPTALDDDTIAERAAQLCSVAEAALAHRGHESLSPIYVIGTEVPTPGGEQSGSSAPKPTRVEDLQRTLESFRTSFSRRGLHDAWERVIGMVVQTGAEFSNDHVFDYDSQKIRHLSCHLPRSPCIVYEAHSTDYQMPSALRKMVEDHFAILKVGPWLTFVYREAIFALSSMERDWLAGNKGVRLSSVREQLDAAMLRNPAHWRDYYGSQEPAMQSFLRMFSFSDRCRYYWPEPDVRNELDLLLGNLSCGTSPVTLISQYFPEQYEAIRGQELRARPQDLIEQHVRRVLSIYSNACGTSGGENR